MKTLKEFNKRVLTNYMYGSIISIGGIFIGISWLDLSWNDPSTFALILIFIISGFFKVATEWFMYNNQIKHMRTVFSTKKSSAEMLKAAYMEAHSFPQNSGLRILAPRLVSFFLPAAVIIFFTNIKGWLELPHSTLLFLGVGTVLIISIHAFIEFFLNSQAIKPVLAKIRELYHEQFGQSLSLRGKVVVSIKQKFYISMLLVGGFPLTLFSIGVLVQMQKTTLPWDTIVLFGIISLLLGLILIIYGSWLMYNNVIQPIFHIRKTVGYVSKGNLEARVKDDYSDEFSSLVSGINHMTANLEARKQKNEQLLNSLFGTLSAVLDARDQYTAGHSIRVASYATEIAKRAGFSEEEILIIKQSALLHDIGKIGVSDEILLKDGALTDEEYNKVKKHSVIGESILKNVEPNEAIESLLPGVRYHHERIDGKGYPDGLSGENIPTHGRILAVADAFDAMTSDRPYRIGMPVKKAMTILRNGRGTQWDAYFTNLLLDYLQEEVIPKLAKSNLQRINANKDLQKNLKLIDKIKKA